MRNIIFSLLENALEDFYAREQRNLELDVHEICHAHRLAIYFEERIREYDRTHEEKQFEQYSVDIEFNRSEGGAVKTVFYNGSLHNTRCDILLHRKGNDLVRDNLLIIELKKEDRTDREQEDILEIQRMVSPKEEGAPDAPICNTLLGIYLKIGHRCYFGTKYWYKDNEIKQERFRHSPEV